MDTLESKSPKNLYLKSALCLTTLGGLGYLVYKYRNGDGEDNENEDVEAQNYRPVGLENLGNTCYMNSLV